MDAASALDEYFRTVHALEYKGTDDDMNDDYADWLTSISERDLLSMIRQHSLCDDFAFSPTA